MNLKNLSIGRLILDPLYYSPQSDKLHKSASIMKSYITKNKKLFNQSQFEVLKRVINSKIDSMTLVQGPPGTGKTHTILGIVSMLADAGIKRIHLCTPSNKAVDEIISRLSQKGFIGEHTSTDFSKIDLEENLLRVGSCEYEASPVIKKHSLDVRINNCLKPALQKNKEMLEQAEEIIRNGVLDEDIEKFNESVQKLKDRIKKDE